jgi:hypothetical protein
MRRLVLQTQMPLDGFVGRPDGDLGWTFVDFSDDFVEWEVERLSSARAHLMGSATYRDMAAYWPSSTEPYAAPMNAIPKVVFSTSLKEAAPNPDRAGQSGSGDRRVERAAWQRSAGPWRLPFRHVAHAVRAGRRVPPAHPSGRARQRAEAVRSGRADPAEARRDDDLPVRLDGSRLSLALAWARQQPRRGSGLAP